RQVFAYYVDTLCVIARPRLSGAELYCPSRSRRNAILKAKVSFASADYFSFTGYCKVKVMSDPRSDFPFEPGTELMTDRARSRKAVETCLESLKMGVLPDSAERQRVDFKEEAGRRGAAGRLLPGSTENTKAADQLADEVAAMANTPGGGALIIGVEDRSGDLLGTDLDVEWLRQQIYRRVEVAPEIEARVEQGIRLLV